MNPTALLRPYDLIARAADRDRIALRLLAAPSLVFGGLALAVLLAAVLGTLAALAYGAVRVGWWWGRRAEPPLYRPAARPSAVTIDHRFAR